MGLWMSVIPIIVGIELEIMLLFWAGVAMVMAEFPPKTNGGAKFIRFIDIKWLNSIRLIISTGLMVFGIAFGFITFCKKVWL